MSLIFLGKSGDFVVGQYSEPGIGRCTGTGKNYLGELSMIEIFFDWSKYYHNALLLEMLNKNKSRKK